jgi:toxin ParE1/3/4
MRIRWTPAAATDHPHFRLRTLRKLYETIRGLKKSPYSGRPGREEGAREILFPPLPYVAVYRVTQQAIVVLRIFHGAQDR